MGKGGGHNRREEHVRLGKTIRNKLCPFCACRITQVNGTREHVLPKGLTGPRPYDFIACKGCNNKKSALDGALSTVLRLSAATPHFQAGFDKMMESAEGRKSLLAILRHCDLKKRYMVLDEGSLGIEADDTSTLVFLEWLKWVARGLYFLETGQCLKTKERHQIGYFFIHPSMLNPRETFALKNAESADARQESGRLESWRHRSETQVFGEGSVYLWCESILKTGAYVSLGGWYTLVVKVSPFSRRAFVDATNDQLRCFGSSDFRDHVVTDIRKRRGKETLIVSKAPSRAC